MGYYDETGLFIINQSSQESGPTGATSNLPEFHIVKQVDTHGIVPDLKTALSKEFTPKDQKCKYPHPPWVACTICGPPQQMDLSVPTLSESVWRRSLQSTVHESPTVNSSPVQEWPKIMPRCGNSKCSWNSIHKPVQPLPAVTVDDQTAAAFQRAREAFQSLPKDKAGPTYPNYVYRPNPLLRTRDYENKNNSMNLQDEDFYCRVKELQFQMTRKPPPDLSKISSRVFQPDIEDLPTPPIENLKSCLWASHSPSMINEHLGGNGGKQRTSTTIEAEGKKIVTARPLTPIEPNPEDFALTAVGGESETLYQQSQIERKTPSPDHQPGAGQQNVTSEQHVFKGPHGYFTTSI